MPTPEMPNPAPARMRLRHLQPLCLAFLARKPGSGYDVRTALTAWPPFAGTPPDAPGIYRTLQAFARRGLLRARQHPPAKGPPRVEFTLTPAGFDALAAWQTTLHEAQQELQAVLELLHSVPRPTSEETPPRTKAAQAPRKTSKGRDDAPSRPRTAPRHVPAGATTAKALAKTSTPRKTSPPPAPKKRPAGKKR